MPASAVERPREDRPLIAEANLIMERLPGRRVEIIGGQLLLSPAPDGPHSEALMLFAALKAGQPHHSD